MRDNQRPLNARDERLDYLVVDLKRKGHQQQNKLDLP